MRRKITFLILLVLIIGSFGGCMRKDDRTVSLYELEFSDKAVKELKEAYTTQLRERALFEITDFTAEKAWEVVMPKQGNLEGRGCYLYYGTFNDCVVWVVQGAGDEIVDFELAGSRFYNPLSVDFLVCRNSKLIMLEEAYEQGFISAEDIAIVADRHCEYNEANGVVVPPDV